MTVGTSSCISCLTKADKCTTSSWNHPSSWERAKSNNTNWSPRQSKKNSSRFTATTSRQRCHNLRKRGRKKRFFDELFLAILNWWAECRYDQAPSILLSMRCRRLLISSLSRLMRPIFSIISFSFTPNSDISWPFLFGASFTLPTFPKFPTFSCSELNSSPLCLRFSSRKGGLFRSRVFRSSSPK